MAKGPWKQYPSWNKLENQVIATMHGPVRREELRWDIFSRSFQILLSCFSDDNDNKNSNIFVTYTIFRAHSPMISSEQLMGKVNLEDQECFQTDLMIKWHFKW